MKIQNASYSINWLKLLLPIGILMLSACAMTPVEGSDSQYLSRYDRPTHMVDGFNVRSATNAPEQITLMFRIDVEPNEAFQLVSDVHKLATWFTDIKNPKVDNTNSDRGPNQLGVNSLRSCSLDGEILYEEYVHYDDKNLSYAYAIDMENSTVDFPISNAVSMFTVESDGKGGSLISWRHYFDKNFHIVAPVINMMFEQVILKPAVENLFDQYGGEWVEPNQT